MFLPGPNVFIQEQRGGLQGLMNLDSLSAGKQKIDLSGLMNLESFSATSAGKVRVDLSGLMNLQ